LITDLFVTFGLIQEQEKNICK